MPQLDVSTFASQLFWLTVTFSLLYWILLRKGLPRVSEILEKRHSRISSDLEAAQSMQHEAEQARRDFEQSMLLARQEASTQIRTAYDAMEQQERERHGALDSVIMKKVEEAEKRLRAQRESALSQLVPVSESVAKNIILRMMPKEANDAIDEGVVQSLVKKEYRI